MIDKMGGEGCSCSGTLLDAEIREGLRCKLAWNAENLSDKVGKSLPQQKFGLTFCWLWFTQFHPSRSFLVAIQSEAEFLLRVSF